ncbi:MAG TPA: PadR family transcriptional regulator [Actinomycetota bacterium]|nr:PadR family transcriptional regulator [Actinomycetota bacterium]
MSRPDLTPVSYVVLGLVARDGPSTPYALKTAVGRGVAHFSPFPHSQIYAETGRLAGLGLLAEEREHTGRRRRSYRITGEGRAALAAWLAEPTDEPPQFRSLGLLKLFFSQHAEPEDVAELARTQVALHRQYLTLTAGIIDRLQARGDRPGQLAVAEIMNDGFRAMAGQWERVERAVAELPGPVAAARDR